MFAVVWLAVAALGLCFVAMGWRVYVDDDWERGDWWAFTSYLALRGLLLVFLFPTTRSPHSRRSERVNAVVVALWGALLFAGGVALCWYERSR